MIPPVFYFAIAAGLAFFGASRLAPEDVAAVPSPVPTTQAARPPVVLEILELPSPHQDRRPQGVAIDTIIVHDTETPNVSHATTIANWFLHPKSQVSAHYIIGKAGELVQCVPDEMRAWHAGPSTLAGRERVNDFSIGIELVNAQTGDDPFTEAQYGTLAALTADLMTRFPAISPERITGHRHVTKYPRIKRDPANNFDWKRYHADVQKLLTAKTAFERRPVEREQLARKLAKP
ncbi:MAG: N-acetylmuramoyl-L-alanine amidase [Candidatus Sericytochromatia bacterium]